MLLLPFSTTAISSMPLKVSVKERFIIPESKVPSLMAGAFDLNGEVKRLRDKGYLPYHTHLTHTPKTYNIPHIPYHATHTAVFSKRLIYISIHTVLSSCHGHRILIDYVPLPPLIPHSHHTLISHSISQIIIFYNFFSPSPTSSSSF